MSQIMKAFTGIIMVLFMMVSATGIIGAFLQVLHAQNLHAAIIDELENSNFTKSVLKECFVVAENAGYSLEMTLYSQAQPEIKCDSSGNLPEDTSGISMAEVILKYPFQVAYFEVDIEQQLFGYAR